MLTFHIIWDIFYVFQNAFPFSFNCMFSTATLIIFANEPALEQKLWNRNTASINSNEPASKKRLAKILIASVRWFVISADDRRIIKCNVDIHKLVLL